MPTPNDLSARPVQVLINNGTNDLNVSAAFLQVAYGAGEFSQDGWWRPTAQLTLAANTDLIGESFHPRTNAARWQPGNLVTISLDLGTGYLPLPTRLVIQKWPAIPRRGQQRITLQLCGDPTRLSYLSPEGDPGGATFGTSTSRTAIINACLSQAGHPTLASGNAVAGYSLSYSPEKKDAGSWIDFAGALAYSANHLLWQQADGSARATLFNLATLTALPCFAHYVVGSTEAKYEPQDPTDTPPDTFKGTGTGLTLTPASNDSEAFTSTVNSVEVNTNISYSDQGTNNPSKTVEVSKPANVVMPDKRTDTTEITDTETTTEDSYNLADGTLDQTVITVREPRGKVLDGDSSTLIDTKETTVEYFYDSDKTVTERRTTTRVTNSNAVLVDFGVKREKWYKRGGSDKWNYIVDETTNDTDAKAPKVASPPTNQAPPATQYQPPANTKEQADYEAEITVASPTGGGYAGKPQVISLPGGLAVSDAQVLEVIKLWAAIRHGRQWPLAWAAPLTPAWLTSFSPIRRIDFTDLDGDRTAYLVDALQIVATTRTARIGGSAIELGTTNADGSATPTPPYTITA
jgi:hypothetical protein